MDIKPVLRISLNLFAFAVLLTIFSAGSKPVTGLAVAIALFVIFYGLSGSIDPVRRVFRINRKTN